MTGISSPSTPLKFDANGNVLANINAQNITPNAVATNIKTDSAGNVLANINAQNITPNAVATNITTDANGNVLANINAQNIYPYTYGHNLAVLSDITLNSNTGFNTIYIYSNNILTIPSGVTVIVEGSITGAGGISLDGTLVVIGNVSIPGNIVITGSGILHITSSSVLTVNAELIVNGISIVGGGTLNISSNAFLIQDGNIILGGALNINVSGTWNNNGYEISTTQGSTITWTTTGALNTSSTPGTLSISGDVYYYGNGLTTKSSNAVPTFVLSLTGSGLFMASPTSTVGNATNAITLSSTSIAPNSADGSAAGSGKTVYFYLTQLSNTAAGLYGLGVYNATANTYNIFSLIYIGASSSTFYIGYYANSGQTDISGDTIEVFNANGSAGTITLTGTAYV